LHSGLGLSRMRSKPGAGLLTREPCGRPNLRELQHGQTPHLQQVGDGDDGAPLVGPHFVGADAVLLEEGAFIARQRCGSRRRQHHRGVRPALCVFGKDSSSVWLALGSLISRLLSMRPMPALRRAAFAAPPLSPVGSVSCWSVKLSVDGQSVV